MGGRELIGWTAFALFVLAMAVMVLMILSPAVERYDIVSPEAMVWAVGVLALLATFAGFLAFTTPQGKVAAIGGLLLLIAIILVTPVAVKISPGSPTHLE